MKTVLTIAGSDSIGGAGIQADIKTISANGCYAMSVITAVTAQNTTGVTGIHDIPPEFVLKQLEAVFDDITPDAVKIGMLSNAEIIYVIADFLRKRKAVNVVADTVMVSTSGHRLLADLLYADGVNTWFETKKIDNPNTHGTGCTLSSAIASNLAKGMDVKESVKLAKDYVTGAIMDGLDLGRGRGPLNHMYKNII